MIPGERHMECAYYFDFCRLCLRLSESNVDDKEGAGLVQGLPIDRARTRGLGLDLEWFKIQHHDHVLAHDDRF